MGLLMGSSNEKVYITRYSILGHRYEASEHELITE